MRMLGSGALIVAALACAIALLGAATASAAIRYAAPGGTADDLVCTSPAAAPCSISEAAAGNNVMPADEAIIAPGNYSDLGGDLGASDTVQPVAGNVHGAAGLPRPKITLSDPSTAFGDGAFVVGTGTTLSHLEVESATARNNITVSGGVAEDLIVRSSSTVAFTFVCNHRAGLIRNSACLSSGDGATALGTSLGTGPGTYTVTVRNVTAIATGSGSNGVFYWFAGAGVTLNVSVKSAIARGGNADVKAFGQNGAATNVILDHSNYLSTDTTMGGATITTAGTNDNQTSAPIIAVDGYHQASGSPTINAGATDGSSGTSDIDGQSRTIDAIADIGADERGRSTSVAMSCAPPSPTLGSSSTCNATVTDVAPGTPAAPTGSVSFTSSASGSFGSGGACALAPTMAAGQSSCQVAYTPGALGTHQITGVYGAGTAHEGSQGGTPLAVTAPAPPSATPQVAKKCRKGFKQKIVKGKKKCVRKKRKK